MPSSVDEKPCGIYPALPTPLDANGAVDERGLEKLVDYVIKGGVHGLWVLGSTSEFPALSPADRERVLDVAIRGANGRVPAIVGVTDNSPRQIIANAEAAQSAGAAACFMTLPFYFIVDQQEAIRHVRETAEAVTLPLILYDNPPSTGIKLTLETLREMSEIPNLIALKDSSCDFIRFQNSLITLREKRPFKLLQGIDQLLAASLMMGADGAVAALASIAPNLFARMYQAAKAKELSELLRLNRRLLRLCRLYAIGGEWTDSAFFMGMKAALEVLGICGRTVCRPFHAMPKEKMPEVEKLLAECEISGMA